MKAQYLARGLLVLIVLAAVEGGIASPKRKGAGPSVEVSQVVPWYGPESAAQPLYLLSQESLPREVKGCPAIEKKADSLCVLDPGPLAELQGQLLQHYSLPGIVSPPADPEKPVGWVDPWKDPEKALKVGIPVRMKRQAAVMIPSAMTLPTLASFQGESANISRLNSAIDYWFHKRAAEAEAILSDLVKELKSRPAGDPERMIVNLISGFYWLEVSTKVALHEDSHEIPVGTLRSKARQGFLEGIGKVNPQAYADKVDWGMEAGLFEELLSSSVFIDEDQPKTLKRRVTKRQDRAFRPEAWIRAVAPIALFNVVSLSRARGLYGQAFDAAEALEAVVPSMKKEIGDLRLEGSSVLTSDDVPRVAKTWMLRPMSLADLESITFLIRADALKKETVESMKLTDKAIRRATSKELAAVAFATMGSVFYDRGNDFWSRRLYAWAEIMAPRLVQRFPDALLWGAESTFWRGDFVRAQRAFEQLRLHLSDPAYGPILNLRLLELELWHGEEAEAEASLARLQTHYGATSIATDLVVLDFCRTVGSLSAKLRRIEYERVLTETKDARYELRERSAACLLRASLLDQEDQNRKRDDPSGTEIAEDANAQLALLQSFDKEYPESPYRPLFDERQKRLELSPVFSSLASNRCSEVLEFYLKNETQLQATSKIRLNDPVKGLNWTEAQMGKTFRCAAFVRDQETWKKLRGKSAAKESMEDLVFDWREKSSDESLNTLRKRLVDEEGWSVFDRRLKDLHADNVALLDDQEFWQSLARAEVLAAEPPESDHRFYEEPLDFVLAGGASLPNSVSLDSIVCLWAQKALQATGDLLRDRLMRFARSNWADTIVTKDGLKIGSPDQCFTRIKAQAIAASVRQPHVQTDEAILWPFVERVGPLLQPELAFDLAKRSFERSGRLSDPVIEVMEKIALESSDTALSGASKKWLRDHKSRLRRSVW